MYQETSITNPFPGLRAFEEEEDVLFFGREKQVDELLKILRTARFMAVIGSSGSGKSSLVKSGLIPSLHAGFMSGAGSTWRICTFRPGANPIANMAVALTEENVLYDQLPPEDALTMAAINESVLRRSSNGLVEVYRQSGVDTRNNLLVLVDQFEEIFRFSRLEKDAKEGRRDSIAFINLLLKATEQRQYPIYVVFTMRSDFLGDCTEFRGLPEAINQGQYLVPRMTREERKDAITGPVAVGGATISLRLINTLLNDVGDNPDQLPILQHAMMRTWTHWQHAKTPANEVDVDDYEAIGTMEHALSRHAEEAWAELTTPREQKIAELLFKAITDKGSDARGIRRPRRFADIAALSGASKEELTGVINVFRKKGRGFLMPPDHVPLADDTIIDISHESIMRVWERLMAWLDEENENAQTYLRICEAATLYEQSKGGLLRDPELQVALKWKELHQPNAAWAERYNEDFSKAMLFLETSRSAWEQEQQHKEMLQRQRLQKARRFVAIVSVVAVCAMFLAIYSYQQKNVANRQTLIATQQTRKAVEQQTIAQQQRNLAFKNQQEAERQKGMAQLSEAQALQQKNIADEQRSIAIRNEQAAQLQRSIAESEKANALRQQTIAESERAEAEKQTRRAEEQKGIAVTNEQKAKQKSDENARLRNLAEARNLGYQSQLSLNDRQVEESRRQALEAYTLNNDNDGPVQNSDVYNALHFNWVLSNGNRNQYTFNRLPVKVISPATNDGLFFTGDEAGNLMALQADGEAVKWLSTFKTGSDVRAVAANAAATEVAVGGADGSVQWLTQQAGRFTPVNKWSTGSLVRQAVFLPDGRLLLLNAAQLLLIDKAKPQPAVVLSDAKAVQQMAVSISGEIAVAAGGKISVYKDVNQLTAGQAGRSYNGLARVTALRFSPDGQYLAAGGYNGGVWLKELSGANDKTYSKTLHQSSVNDVRLARVDGRWQLATAGADQMIHLVDVADALGQDKIDALSLRGHSKWIYGLIYHPSGNQLLSVSEDTRLISWKPSARQLYNALKN